MDPAEPAGTAERPGAGRDRDRLFHIVARAAWPGPDGGWYRPASLAAEGFVHLSYADQVLGVANALYRELPDPVVVEFVRSALGADIVEEDLYDAGQEFPHLYGALPVAAAVAVHPLVADAAGHLGWARTD